MSQLLVLLHSLPDPRFLRKPEHPLTDILVIALCSTLCGGRSFVDMEDFGRAWEPWLRSHLALKLPHGIPSWHTFRRVLSALDPHCFADVFHRWAAALPAFQPPLLPAEQGAPQRQIAVDGKAVCGSRRRGPECQPVMLVNAWLVERGLAIGQRRVPPGCTEQVQLPFVLKALCLRGAIVTADAAHTQPDNASLITARGGDWLFCVKGNQPATLKALQLHFAEAAPGSLAGHVSTDKGHGRIETRHCTVSHAVAGLPVRGLWSGLAAVARVESAVEFPGTGKKPRRSVRYFILRGARSVRHLSFAIPGSSPSSKPG